MENLDRFYNRLKSIGIEVNLTLNYPFMYLYTINGKAVKEKYSSEHGFLIGFAPVRDCSEFHFLDTTELFKTIRKYI